MPPKSLPEIKPGEVDKFDGTNISCRNFLLQVKINLTLNPSTYPTDHSKSIYLISLLKGPAFQWASPLFEQDAEILKNFDAFCETLSTIFQQPGEIQTLKNKLAELHQGSESVTTYAGEFRQISSLLDWNESALIHMFHRGLNERVKDILCAHETPTTLNDMMALAIRIDQRLRERLATIPSHPPSIPRTTPSPASTIPHHKPSEPINEKGGDLSQLWNKLDPRQQRYLHRVLHNLCRYCGSADHHVNNCPDKPGKPPLKGKGQSQF
jgi:hypothetical protein